MLKVPDNPGIHGWRLLPLAGLLLGALALALGVDLGSEGARDGQFNSVNRLIKTYSSQPRANQ